MLAYSVNMDSFLNEFITMIKSIIVKQNAKAELYETADTKRDGDRYVAMKDGSMSWSGIMRFDREVLLAAGIGESIVDDMISNKELIPVNLRTLCVNLQIKKVIDEYVEKNNYYRMLNGEPNIEDTEDDYVYMFENDKGIRTDIPVHQLPISELNYINSAGFDKKLYELHPTKEYLKHLGNRSVSYYKARIALNYSIIYLEKSNIDALNINFGKYYANARNYVMRGLYHTEDKDMFESYDSFMGFNIMVMAINRVVASTFTQGITRDFYDDDLIKTLYECYNIQYEESIAVKHHREIAKRLNVLLQAKSSKQVIFDIIGLFNYRSVKVYEYYLVKDVKKDANGDPVFIYKTVVDEEGNQETVIDPEKTYDIYFQKVAIDSNDPTLEMVDPSNMYPYETLTAEDPYWIDDSDLLNKIYNTNFNSISTKYMSLEVAFDLAKIMYETCHSFRMILERHPETKSIMIKTPYSSDALSLFDVIIFLCALIAKKFGLTGEIPLKPYNIAQVYGFNFSTDLDTLRDDILSQIELNHGMYSEIDPDILKLITSRNIRTLEDVVLLFRNIENLREFIDTAMRYTTDIRAYRGYERLYKALLITTDYAEIYTKFDGTIAKTYLELLQDRRPDLVDYVTGDADMKVINTIYNGNADESDINTKINRMLDVMSNIADDFDEIQYANAKSEIVNNLEKVINQFKSYTVDMQEAGIIYVVNDPHLCMLKILDWITMDYGAIVERDMLVEDVIAQMLVERKHRSDLDLIDNEQMFIMAFMRIIDTLKLWDKLKISAFEKIKDNTNIIDAITNMFNEMILPKIRMKVGDRIAWIDVKMSFEEIIHLDHKIWRMMADMVLKDETFVIDDINTEVAFKLLMLFYIKEEIFYEASIHFKDEIGFIHKYSWDKEMKIKDTTNLIDVLMNITKEKTYKDFLTIRDWTHIERAIHTDNILRIKDRIKSMEGSALQKDALAILDALGRLSKEKRFVSEMTTHDRLNLQANIIIEANSSDNTLEATRRKGDYLTFSDSLTIIRE